MKTAVNFFLFFSIFLLLVASGLSAQQTNLDETITRAARGVEEVLPQGTKVAVLNFASPTETFSDYVIEELTGKLVTGRKVTIVDRRNLALISQEMNLQLSGDVSDDSAQAIGRMLGAQSIVSGTLTNMGTFYRFRVRVINVETAAIQTQVSFDMRNDAQVAFLLGGSSPSVQPAIPTDTSTASATADPPIEGTMVPGASLAAKLSWLQRNAESHNTYILGVNANESIAPATLGYSGGINITIVIRGDSVNRTIRLNANGKMFTVNSNTTFVLDNNITLQGHPGNSGTMVHVNGGTFRMRTGATITGNTNSNASGGGVYVESGTFEMTGGTIRDNTAREYGGGVSMNDSRGIFTMSGGTISGNTAPKGGGVEGGTITMSGGTISGNTASRGGGVNVGRTFIMRGGIITGNTARENGGGIYVGSSSFTKTGGTITGYNSDRTNGNTVRDEEGTIARKGHAVFVNDNRRKETTAGPGDNLSYSNGRATGGWDN